MIRAIVVLLIAVAARAETLEVGPGRRFERIEEAVAKARPGDTILVHPHAYVRPAVIVRTPRLTIRGAKGHVLLSGKGYRYTGVGNVPRAIFQFGPGADGCLLQGFELVDARNPDCNGAGVRINQAHGVTVRDCLIHRNDMGIMSNGARKQLIERCEIHHNGNQQRDGYNHNLYLGGEDVTLRYCDIHHSIAGHNVKSRAHITRVEYCYVHHSSNREFDLVDAAETARPGSDAHLIGNIIAKDPQCPGNRAVIHFGQDGGKGHNGTLHLRFNTIVTPFTSAILQLSAPKARAQWTGNLLVGAGRTLAAPGAERMRGAGNWFSGSYQPGVLDPKTNTFKALPRPIFQNPAGGDYRPTAKTLARLAAHKPPAPPNFEYRAPRDGVARTEAIPGAVTRRPRTPR